MCMNHNTVDYASNESTAQRRRPAAYFVGIAFVVLSFVVLAAHLYIWHESRVQSRYGENYGRLALLFFRPVAMVLNSFLLLGFLACSLSLSKFRWTDGLVFLSLLVALTLIFLMR